VRIGQGFDAHRLVGGRPLRLAGVEIPCERGLEGHSDGDVALHVVAAAILGALAEGDLGRHFPSTDPAWAGADSAVLVTKVVERMRARGYRLGNLDLTIIAQTPRLAPHQNAMTSRLESLLGSGPGLVNVKVTSTDRLGAIGRGEGIAASAVVLLRPEKPPGSRRD
jgi:2-C-methyl-D-erythritol 2,4-cyclodiphosphate synthase